MVVRKTIIVQEQTHSHLTQLRGILGKKNLSDTIDNLIVLANFNELFFERMQELRRSE